MSIATTKELTSEELATKLNTWMAQYVRGEILLPCDCGHPDHHVTHHTFHWKLGDYTDVQDALINCCNSRNACDRCTADEIRVPIRTMLEELLGGLGEPESEAPTKSLGLGKRIRQYGMGFIYSGIEEFLQTQNPPEYHETSYFLNKLASVWMMACYREIPPPVILHEIISIGNPFSLRRKKFHRAEKEEEEEEPAPAPAVAPAPPV